MSEKCDLYHLKLAVFLGIFQAIAAYQVSGKLPEYIAYHSEDNGGECQRDEMLFQRNYAFPINIILDNIIFLDDSFYLLLFARLPRWYGEILS